MSQRSSVLDNQAELSLARSNIIDPLNQNKKEKKKKKEKQNKMRPNGLDQERRLKMTTRTIRKPNELDHSMKAKHSGKTSSLSRPIVTCIVALTLASIIHIQASEARVTFEKMTNRDYSGLTYYTIQNVSLFECLGWCKEEMSCTSAVFSFVVNPFAALQETTCQLQNETQARQGAYLRSLPNGDQVTMVAHPQRATNLYFFNKIELQTESVCNRLWAFERFPNRRLRQRDRPSFHAPNKEFCQAACMSEQRFVCRSLEYNYINQQCSLSGLDRRSPYVIHVTSNAAVSTPSGHASDMLDSPGTDYFENACLLGEDICNESRIYDYAKVGLPLQRAAHFVELNYYPDKEMLVKSQAGCARACTIEHEFICRSILYRSTFKQGQPNCALYHLDHRTFPEGADTFMGPVMQPLLDSGETSALYLEAICNDTIQMPQTTITMPPTSISIMPSSTTPGAISVHPGNMSAGLVSTPASDDPTRFLVSSSTSTLSPLASALAGSSGGMTTIRLPSSAFLGASSNVIPTNIQIPGASPLGLGRPLPPSHITIGPPSSSSQTRNPMTPSSSSILPSHITISPAPPTRTNPMDPSGAGIPTNIQISAGGNPAIQSTNHDQNCDSHGFCYDVSLKCTDTKMVINVKTQRPFFGRIYALGRSETCNANIKNQNQFQLDMYLTGQECNTQSASGTYTNTIVLQHHNVVLTKADKVYHVRCTYETSSRNVSFGMMPVKDMFEVDVNDRNQETISITASSDAPLPKINIMTLDGKEASTVRIGDRLTFRIEIPDNTPYGIFARSCVAMAKDARSTFEIIDENGCPVDHTIFPNFQPASNGNALESNYEAFRFTESYGVIFQCNVKYCIGKCEPVNCGIGRDSVESWGKRRKRSIGGVAMNESSHTGSKRLASDDMTLSREIVVLDLTEKDSTSPTSISESSKDLTTNELSDTGKNPLEKSSLRSFNSHQDHKSNHEANLISSENQGTPKHCISSQSLYLYICSIGLVFILYVWIVACLFSRRDSKISHIKQQFY